MTHLDELRRLVVRHAGPYGRPLWNAGVLLFAGDRVTEPMGTVTEPVLTLVAQGAKRTMLGDHVFEHGPGTISVVTVDLPLTGHITEASPSKLFLALGLKLEPATIAQLLVEGAPSPVKQHEGPGMALSVADDKLLDALVRLVRLLDEPRDLRVLGPSVRREIHWRLLNSAQAALMRQAGTADSRLALVASAIKWIKDRYDRVIRIDDLAADIGTSVSTLNRHFRTVTAMSPLQYQKQIRLQRARAALVSAPHDVAAVGHSVGYDNPSQFSREYRRMFGAPPGQDAARLQGASIVQE
ncbi:AraC family transcriptional regulator [Lentzea flaviverrucosa]|uniref:AraC-type DNA-binding protein n=1 Tax=Lentzea flaviverrucosa TaxID=200379 RepID=A0A1H9BFU9_9PSEU|nr:AraC family transcriptional regulator [Lentzea flaviverrucosa]RDI31784.1 AraC family transcriptional regulator [Lentzea flaviverrucosa]SEP87844.1 AraC-type DNA-binding protein [Lentzea flaviverrucosa]